jgi:hypothetical protein
MRIFNQAARGISPEQSRATFKAARDKTMVERQQSVPVLRPHGMGADEVIRQSHRSAMRQDHNRAKSLNERAKQLYQQQASEIKTQAKHPRQTTNNFNQHAAQAWDMKELSL